MLRCTERSTTHEIRKETEISYGERKTFQEICLILDDEGLQHMFYLCLYVRLKILSCSIVLKRAITTVVRENVSLHFQLLINFTQLLYYSTFRVVNVWTKTRFLNLTITYDYVQPING